MAPRRNPKGGSPGPGGRRETKHGGSKNGKKEGLSGSSFFTWFMVIALLGVWTSVAVVWFELVDYEEVLAKAKDFRYNLSEVLQGKLGIYDADGDGDFDVDDAKILLGLKERSVPEKPTQPTPRHAEETIQTAAQSHAEAEHVHAETEPEDEIESLLHEVLESQLDDSGEDNIKDETPFLDEEENNEISDDTVEAPTLEGDYYDEELDYKMPEIVETPEMPESFQEEPASDYQPGEPEQDETHVSHEIHSNMKEDHKPEDKPEDTDYKELTLEDALEDHTEPLPEDTEQQDYVEEHDLEHEVLIETQDIDGEPLTEHYHGNTQDEAADSDMVTEHIESLHEREQAKVHMADQSRVTDIPVQAEDFSNDNLVDT